MDSKELQRKIKTIPPQLIPEVIDYIEFIVNKYGHINRTKKNIKFDWAGGLSNLSKKYSSVNLQHKSLEWR